MNLSPRVVTISVVYQFKPFSVDTTLTLFISNTKLRYQAEKPNTGLEHLGRSDYFSLQSMRRSPYETLCLYQQVRNDNVSSNMFVVSIPWFYLGQTKTGSRKELIKTDQMSNITISDT